MHPKLYCFRCKKGFYNKCFDYSISSSAISVYSFNFLCSRSLSISFNVYSDTIVGERLLLSANSTTSSSFQAQRITPTLGFSVFFFTSLSNASKYKFILPIYSGLNSPIFSSNATKQDNPL